MKLSELWSESTEWSQKWEPVSFLPLTLSNHDRFAKFFHCLKEKEISNNKQCHTFRQKAALLCEITDTFTYAANLKENENKVH